MMVLVKQKSESPSLVMLVGLPASGKSTYIKSLSEKFNELKYPTTVVSTDNYIELVAMERMMTYNQVFVDTIEEATKHANRSALEAIQKGHHIIWDQTNLTVAGRRKKLAMIPYSYFKKAVVICCSTYEEWQRRLGSRPGKVIPDHVLTSMAKSLVIPTHEEGFDSVEHVFT